MYIWFRLLFLPLSAQISVSLGFPTTSALVSIRSESRSVCGSAWSTHTFVFLAVRDKQCKLRLHRYSFRSFWSRLLIRASSLRVLGQLYVSTDTHNLLAKVRASGEIHSRCVLNGRSFPYMHRCITSLANGSDTTSSHHWPVL